MTSISGETTNTSTGKPRHGSEAPSDSARVQFATRFFGAIRRRDAQKVRELAKQAGNEQWPESVRSLCDFLAPPSTRWRSPRRKRGWPEARAAAVWALGRIGEPAGHDAMTSTLTSDADPMVRAAAAAALENLGPIAVPSLIQAMRYSTEWELDGMRLALHQLGEPSRVANESARAANVALVDVLYENIPRRPRRWARAGREFGRMIAILVMVASTVALLREGWALLPALVVSWIPGQAAGFTISMAASLILGALNGRVERNVLHAAAADSLVRLNDKRAIPAMLQLAFITPLSASGRHARSVLRQLLPQVTVQDMGLFSATDIDTMNGALNPFLDTELLAALLRALEAVGNRASIRRVQRIAQRSRSSEIRIQADRVLQVLKEREARMKLSQTLLRGAPAPTGAPAELLRASVQGSVDPPEQLLRATQVDGPA